MIDRRALPSSGLALPAIGSAAAPRDQGAEEWTFLRSIDKDPAALLRFIEANWLAMDRKAIAAGIFAEARLLVAVDAPADDEWNVAMAVRYFSAGGYDDVKPQFDRIKTAHSIIRPDGKGLAELGRIVGNRRLVMTAHD